MLEVRSETPHQRALVAVEVQRIRHHDPIERRKVELFREVAAHVLDRDGREPFGHRFALHAQRSCVAFDRKDPTLGSEQIRERQRERALARPEVGPHPAGHNAVPEERDMVGMTHLTKAIGTAVRDLM